ncbi:hypothetical protein D3C73_1623160 [compost metagenome]
MTATTTMVTDRSTATIASWYPASSASTIACGPGAAWALSTTWLTFRSACANEVTAAVSSPKPSRTL